ncbi:MAG: efflux RND transporter periplasmic adaptor subunit [Acidobacteria bacterium]|nr:efflux RND transporter periplasmic adaptor subunit [Acidobacteriota bacterium]
MFNRTQLLAAAGFLMLAGTVTAQSFEVATVTSKVLERKTRLPGEFTSFQIVDLHARVNSYVEKVSVDIGSAVKEGDVLVTLSAPEMQAQVAEAEARVPAVEAQKVEAQAKLLAAESTYERIREASRTPGAVAANELVLAEKAVEAAKGVIGALDKSVAALRAAVAAQKELLGYLRVTAPFDGVVTQRWAHPGALAGPAAAGKALLRLEQQSRLRLLVAVPEAETGGIVRGAKVPFTLPAFPGETFTGAIARMPHNMDMKTRTMPVELDVVNPSGRLTPGMYPEVQWPFRRPRASMLVPPAAVVTTTERTFVVRVNDGKAEWVNVSKGSPTGDLVEVFGNLKEGDVVVKRATDEIRDGSAITVKR